MKAKEFWEVFNKEIVPHFTGGGFCFVDHPVGGDSGIFLEGLFQNENGIWCTESTRERSNHPYHHEYNSEEEAVNAFLQKAKYYADIKGKVSGE